jgi:hypothetical protein
MEKAFPSVLEGLDWICGGLGTLPKRYVGERRSLPTGGCTYITLATVHRVHLAQGNKMSNGKDSRHSHARTFRRLVALEAGDRSRESPGKTVEALR